MGSVNANPEIEALNSPSHLMNAADGRTIYPTIHPFVVPPSALATATPQAAILSHAATLAQAHRRGGAESPAGLAKPVSRSRRGSTTSLRSLSGTPPATPPAPSSRRRIMSFGRRSTDSPLASPRGSAVDLTAMGQTSADSGDDRPNIRSRLSAYIRNDQFTREGSPFDAVINFIPSPPLNVDTQRALHEMLQYTVVLTSAAMPILMSAVTTNSVTQNLAMTELAPLSLVHIVPVDAPPALAPVIERFLLPLLPTMGRRVRRDLFGVVTGLGAWLAPQADPANVGLPGAETILFGGVRCPSKNVTDEDRQQAMLAGWNHCLCAPGMLVEMEREEPAPVFSKRASALELSNIRPRARGHSREPSSSSVLSTSSASPPKSPQMSPHSPPTPVAALPPGAAPRAATTSTKSSTTKPSTYSPRMPPSLPQGVSRSYLAASSSVSAATRMSTRSSSSGTSSTTTSTRTTVPSSRSTPSSSPTSESPSNYTSRFDPRNMDRSMDTAKSLEARSTTSTLRPSAPDLSTITTKSLPPGAAASGEMGELADSSFGLNTTKKRTPSGLTPSGLRNPVALPASLQPSPPTPELDTSGSSCSSSSVIEPSWAAERPESAKSPNLLRSMSSRKGFGFTSLFRRNGVRA